MLAGRHFRWLSQLLECEMRSSARARARADTLYTSTGSAVIIAAPMTRAHV